MTGFFLIKPEVAGGIGDRTILDRSVHPPIVKRLHYSFADWSDDAILRTFPAYIVTDHTRQELLRMRATGVTFDTVIISWEHAVYDIPLDKMSQTYVWLKPYGEAGRDDFGVLANGNLIISNSVLTLFRKIGIAHAFVKPFDGQAVTGS